MICILRYFYSALNDSEEETKYHTIVLRCIMNKTLRKLIKMTDMTVSDNLTSISEKLICFGKIFKNNNKL